jgi:50S ribosomal subunit-associated GTPase HflX
VGVEVIDREHMILNIFERRVSQRLKSGLRTISVAGYTLLLERLLCLTLLLGN